LVPVLVPVLAVLLLSALRRRRRRRRRRRLCHRRWCRRHRPRLLPATHQLQQGRDVDGHPPYLEGR
jgi:hypothetical protein